MCSLFPVLIQLLQPWWIKSWPAFQPWKQERWGEASQLFTHFAFFLSTVCFPITPHRAVEEWVYQKRVCWSCSVWEAQEIFAVQSTAYSFFPSQVSKPIYLTSPQRTYIPTLFIFLTIWLCLTVTLQTHPWKRNFGEWKRTDLWFPWAKLFPEQTRGRISPNIQRSRKRNRNRLLELKMLLCSCSEHWERSCTANVSHISQL